MKRSTRPTSPLCGLAFIVSIFMWGPSPSLTQAGDSGSYSLSTAKSSFRFEGTLDEPTQGLEYAADFIFRLYDLPDGGKQIGPSLQKTSVLVSDGTFITTIDFGDLSTTLSTFKEVWLQVEVRRPGETDGFSPLSPRHRIAVAQPRLSVFTPTQLLGTRPLDSLFGSSRNLGLAGGLSARVLGGLPGTSLNAGPFNHSEPGLFNGSALRGVSQTYDPSDSIQASAPTSVTNSYATGTTPTSLTPTTFAQPAAPNSAFANPVLIPTTRASGPTFQSSFNPQLGSSNPQPRLMTPDFVGHAAPQAKAPPAYFNGRVLLDEGGEAWVMLPEQVPSLYKDPTYHLTAIGRPAPMLHVSSRERDGRFKISGGSPGLEISWVVMGTRHDTWGSHATDLTTINVSAATDDRILAPILFETKPSAQSSQASTSSSNAAIARRRGKGPMITEVIDVGD